MTPPDLDADFTEVIDPQSGADITDDYVLPSAPPNGVNASISYEFPLWRSAG